MTFILEEKSKQKFNYFILKVRKKGKMVTRLYDVPRFYLHVNVQTDLQDVDNGYGYSNSCDSCVNWRVRILEQ